MNEEVCRHSRFNAVDRIGVFASSACAAHCALSAFLPSALGALGLGVLLGHEAEWGFVLVAVAFAATALLLGWLRHRSGFVAAVLAIGIGGLLLARMMEEAGSSGAGTATGLLAGVVLVTGHLSNLRASRLASRMGQTSL
ncbi:MAG: MerC family mercury resistance protein [Thermoanaerobaculia bacterium]|nr:MerC family mercury resistance protein [Thermoanaerobaculia bacterium]